MTTEQRNGTTDQGTVIFRTYADGQIIALWPYVLENATMCQSYQQVGQHAPADYTGTIRSTRPATPEQYRPLESELKRLGYWFSVDQRRSARQYRKADLLRQYLRATPSEKARLLPLIDQATGRR